MKKEPITDKDKALLVQYGLSDINLSKGARILLTRGEYLSQAGEPMNALYFVVSGKAKVFISLSDGKELLLAYFTQKGIIGEIELMTDAITTQTTVQAVSDLVCLALPLSVYAAELKRNAVFLNFVAKDLAEKLAQRVINSAITALQPLETRLCAYILQTASYNQSNKNNQNTACEYFNEKLTEVASVMGASYRHLLRCLGTMCNKKFIEKTPAGYKIINRRLMEKHAGDLYVLN